MYSQLHCLIVPLVTPRTSSQAIKLVVKVLSKTMDSTTLSPDKVELATLSRDEDAGQVGMGVDTRCF